MPTAVLGMECNGDELASQNFVFYALLLRMTFLILGELTLNKITPCINVLCAFRVINHLISNIFLKY